MTTAVRVNNLSKCYHLGQIGFRSFKEDLERRWTQRRTRSVPDIDPETGTQERTEGNPFWALRDISFEVPRGGVVGIIGRNGAGKSTLLKILSRITEPTTGRAELRGKVSSLLEVGTGFHPELTGRENVYLSASIFGMKKGEVRSKFDQIVAFSGVDTFIDTPVKRYSSGMYVRLAFAVAAHLEPEIMIVDEVLAVGDADFQKKCLGKMGDVSKQGRTILFVSHNMAMIKTLCQNCIWLDDGRVREIGPASDIVHDYLGQGLNEDGTGEQNLEHWPNRYGDGPSHILSARLLDEHGNPTNKVCRGGSMTVEFVVRFANRERLRLSCTVFADGGEKILHMSGHDTPGFTPPMLSGVKKVSFTMPSIPLTAGKYKLGLGVHAESSVPLDAVLDVLPFEAVDMIDSPRPYLTSSRASFCWVPTSINIEDANL